MAKYDIKSIFGKGYIHTEYKDELCFTSIVENFFKYDNYISLKKQFKIMEFYIDLIIGNSVFIEFDEKQHYYQKNDDIERMQKISLSNTYYNGYLHNTNDFKNQSYNESKYEKFTTYKFNGCLFIRIYDKNCLNWIPLVYEYYCENMDLLMEVPNCFKGDSNKLISLKYVC